MSTTYEISCDKCRVQYWCGQRGGGAEIGRLYSAEMVFAFLTEHEGHPLRFDMSEFAPEGYREVEAELKAKLSSPS